MFTIQHKKYCFLKELATLSGKLNPYALCTKITKWELWLKIWYFNIAFTCLHACSRILTSVAAVLILLLTQWEVLHWDEVAVSNTNWDTMYYRDQQRCTWSLLQDSNRLEMFGKFLGVGESGSSLLFDCCNIVSGHCIPKTAKMAMEKNQFRRETN